MRPTQVGLSVSTMHLQAEEAAAPASRDLDKCKPDRLLSVRFLHTKHMPRCHCVPGHGGQYHESESLLGTVYAMFRGGDLVATAGCGPKRSSAERMECHVGRLGQWYAIGHGDPERE